jgi:hypothetical protein
MGLLQDPCKALDQAEWYLNNTHHEIFPGAFELAAGNLCRQTVEQMLFILCFYSRMPRNRFMRTDRTLKTAGTLINELNAIAPSGGNFWDAAKAHRHRVAKFARTKARLKRWARDLNEPSHFALKHRKLDLSAYEKFINFAHGVFDKEDCLLIIAAVNEIFSNGRLTVHLSGSNDLPCMFCRDVIQMKHFERSAAGKLSLSTPEHPVCIVSDSEVPRGRWPHALVIPQHCVGVSLGSRFVTPRGDPVDLQSFETVIRSFANTPAQRRALRRRFKQLGFDLQFSSNHIAAK